MSDEETSRHGMDSTDKGEDAEGAKAKQGENPGVDEVAGTGGEGDDQGGLGDRTGASGGAQPAEGGASKSTGELKK